LTSDSHINALLLSAPAGVSEPDRLVDIVPADRRTGVSASSYPTYLDLRERVTSLGGVYAYHLDLDAMSMGRAEGAERIFANVVTTNYFSVLGVAAAEGRLFGANDSEQPGASPIVVLSHRFWTRRFNGNPAIVGETLRLNGHPFTVVGVAHPDFRGSSVVAPDVWVPAAMTAVVSPNDKERLTSRMSTWLMIGGRLKPGVSMAQAAAEVDAVSRALQREYAEPRGYRLAGSSPIPSGLRLVVAGFLALLMASVSIVLIIACANVAGVLLARATARRREIAVRLAVGAGRVRLVLQLLTETALLFLAGGAAGLMLARGMTLLVVALLPAFPLPVNLSFPIDARAMAFATGLSLIAALLSGLVPALQASKADVVSALKDDAQGPSDRLRLRNAFVIGQVAFSILLVVCAGLLLRALERTGSIDQGFDPRGIEVVSLDLSLAGYTNATGPGFARELLNRVRELPGVEAATMADHPPGRGRMILGRLTATGVTLPDDRSAYDTDWHTVQPGYFATLGIPLVAGRDFSDVDLAGGEPVVIVSESTARRFWPALSDASNAGVEGPALSDASNAGVEGPALSDASNAGVEGPALSDGSIRGVEGPALSDGSIRGVEGLAGDAVGKQLIWLPGVVDRPAAQQPPGRMRPNPISPRPLLIVGVVRDVKSTSGNTAASVYLPLQQHYTSRLTVLARSRLRSRATEPRALARQAGERRLTRELQLLVASVDRNLPVLTARTLEEEQTGPVHVQLRIASSVSGSVGLVGLLLAAIGIYGVTAYTVARRTREIGIRIAMGAQRANVIGMVLGQGMRLVLIGAAIGLLLAAGASRLLVRLLFGVPPLDPITFAGAAVLFAAVGLAACWVPVRRATAVDPVAALRYE
jgi:hypothetical protein